VWRRPQAVGAGAGLREGCEVLMSSGRRQRSLITAGLTRLRNQPGADPVLHLRRRRGDRDAVQLRPLLYRTLPHRVRNTAGGVCMNVSRGIQFVAPLLVVAVGGQTLGTASPLPPRSRSSLARGCGCCRKRAAGRLPSESQDAVGPLEGEEVLPPRLTAGATRLRNPPSRFAAPGRA